MPKPPWRLVHVLKRELKSAVMHRHQPSRSQFLKDFDRFIRSHVNIPERFRMISAYWQQGDLRGAYLSDVFESVKIGAVARVIDPASLVLKDKSAVAAMMIPQHAGAPMFAR